MFFVQDGNCDALDAIFTYHGKETLPHTLAILSNFDETIPPSEYQALLPEAGWVWKVNFLNIENICVLKDRGIRVDFSS